jgi:hypothetical protein
MSYRKKLSFFAIELFIIIFIIIFSGTRKHGKASQTGDLICGSEGDQQAPAVAFSDSDSYIIVWQDFRSGTSFDIYGAGAIGGESFGPKPICTVSRDQKHPVVAWDGVHYIVIWEDDRNGEFYDIYGVRLAKNGTLMDNDGQASSSGIPICTAPNDQMNPDLVWNGRDCFLVVWEDYRNSDADIYGVRVSEDLKLFEGPAEDSGFILCQVGGTQSAPSVAWNGKNFFVVWEDFVSEESRDIRGLRVSPAGEVLDDILGGGIAISLDHDIQCNPDIASDGEGFFVVWNNHTLDHGYPDIYGILVSNEGQVYQNEPLAISTAVYNQVNPAVFWAENNYICFWKDDRDNIVDIYWTRMNNMGELLNGTPDDGGTALGLDMMQDIRKTDTPPGATFFQAKGVVVWEKDYTGQLDLYVMKLVPPVPPLVNWTGESGYESDGLEPDTGYGGETFTFRVLYKDNEGTPPQIAQIWIDLNGDMEFTFPGDSQIDMDLVPEEVNPDYSIGVVYQAKIALNFSGEEGVAYRFYFKDDIDEATGPPVKISTVMVENKPPVLYWCDKEGYFTDGVDPDQAEGSFYFQFMVNYKDIEGDLPEVAEVWIDMDDSGTYEQRERFVMLEADQEEINTGRDYKKKIKILYVGDGKINYRFLFTDGFHLAESDPNQDDPTKNHILSVQPHLMAPILSWPMDEDFLDGVQKGTGDEENLFTFKVGYRDPDNDPPVTKQVWVDLNGDEIFKEDERFDMSTDSLQDEDFTEVNYYVLQKTISYSGEGEMVYKFVFDDGWNIATGEPFLEGGTIMVQSPISLEWSSAEGFGTDGADPDTGSFETFFEFRVIYFNQYGYPPTVKEIWLDENMDAQYEEEEKYIMEDVDPIDMDYEDGKEYFKIIQYKGEATGSVPYRFVFSDIYMSAEGPPAQEGFSIQVSATGDPQGGNDNTSDISDEGQLAWEELDSKGVGCFIQGLWSSIHFTVEPGNELDDIHMRTEPPFIRVWLTVFKFGLLLLLIMALICFVMFGYSILKRGYSMPKGF